MSCNEIEALSLFRIRYGSNWLPVVLVQAGQKMEAGRHTAAMLTRRLFAGAQ